MSRGGVDPERPVDRDRPGRIRLGTGFALLLQLLAGAAYFFGLASWGGTTGGGFTGTAESIGKTTLPTVMLVLGGSTAIITTAMVGGRWTTSLRSWAIGVAGTSVAAAAAVWMVLIDYPGMGLGAIAFTLGLYIVTFASAATLLGFVFTLPLARRKA